MKHYNHIVRFIAVITVVIIVFFLIRNLTVPKTFGTHGTYVYGYHRGASDAENASIPTLFQGSTKCKKCHEDQYKLTLQAKHVAISCETCHGFWQAHNNNTQDKIPKDSSDEACMKCHGKLGARPASFSQITDLKQHVETEKEEFKEGMTCKECHDPHDPTKKADNSTTVKSKQDTDTVI